jgi:hypothetical protein
VFTVIDRQETTLTKLGEQTWFLSLLIENLAPGKIVSWYDVYAIEIANSFLHCECRKICDAATSIPIVRGKIPN